uniref:Disease resistance R13L4/SHOC-2-like LRR domain-containing protein n=1 Tax=Globodera rostochiensis TaxID=31243 RepID=A0A914HYP4_GLORO
MDESEGQEFVMAFSGGDARGRHCCRGLLLLSYINPFSHTNESPKGRRFKLDVISQRQKQLNGTTEKLFSSKQQITNNASSNQHEKLTISGDVDSTTRQKCPNLADQQQRHHNHRHNHHQKKNRRLSRELQQERCSSSSSVISTSTNSSVVSFEPKNDDRREYFLPADKFALCFQKALLVGRKLDDKIRLGNSMEKKSENGGMEQTLEFRPQHNNCDGGSALAGGTAKGGESGQRSKSPGGHIINKISNFARGKYRNSLSERQSNAVGSEEKVRKDINRELIRCKEAGEARLDLNSSELVSIPTSIQTLTQLTELFVYKNKLTSLPSELGQLVNLRILGLSENNLSTLPESLSSLKKLETLDLRHNKINEEIPPVVFQMESLETLWLRYNKIKSVSAEIRRLRRLKMMDLRENKITELPATIAELQCLSILLLSSNQLKRIPDEIGQCVQLTQLDLQHNELESLPESIGSLVALKRLGIRYNHLLELPSTLAQCTLLDEFVVESNKLQALPDGILNALPSLKSINLSRNQLSAIPQGGFEQTVSVNVEHNSISKENELTAFPLDFGTWVTITELNVSNNEIHELPLDIDKLINLEVLVLSTNRLKKLPTQIGSLRRLRELDLEENELEAIPSEIGFLTALTKLWIQSNQLTSLPRTIGNLSNLVDFRVGENLLTFIPEEIGHLENLKSLYLNDNPNLHSLPFELVLCSSLEIMSIERCPLSQIPSDIIEGGPSLVIQYLKMHGPYRGTTKDSPLNQQGYSKSQIVSFDRRDKDQRFFFSNKCTDDNADILLRVMGCASNEEVRRFYCYSFNSVDAFHVPYGELLKVVPNVMYYLFVSINLDTHGYSPEMDSTLCLPTFSLSFNRWQRALKCKFNKIRRAPWHNFPAPRAANTFPRYTIRANNPPPFYVIYEDHGYEFLAYVNRIRFNNFFASASLPMISDSKNLLHGYFPLGEEGITLPEDEQVQGCGIPVWVKYLQEKANPKNPVRIRLEGQSFRARFNEAKNRYEIQKVEKVIKECLFDTVKLAHEEDEFAVQLCRLFERGQKIRAGMVP